MNMNNNHNPSLLQIRIWILFIIFWTANMNMNIICKEYSRIYSNTQIFKTPWFTIHLFIYNWVRDIQVSGSRFSPFMYSFNARTIVQSQSITTKQLNHCSSFSLLTTETEFVLLFYNFDCVFVCFSGAVDCPASLD